MFFEGAHVGLGFRGKAEMKTAHILKSSALSPWSQQCLQVTSHARYIIVARLARMIMAYFGFRMPQHQFGTF